MSETNRQLKDKLNSNQAMRERMCIDLLSTEPHFTEVKPRLPQGGPDGGRDIEAVYKTDLRAVGAVGFVNDATSTTQHRTQARTKFADDLQAACAIPADHLGRLPRFFVFFTNVGLPPDTITELQNDAIDAGMQACEVYDRERLRLLLDSSKGYAIRQRYLDIPLTDAEQKVFFDNWGEQIQAVISRGIDTVQSTTSRLLFLAEAQVPVDRISVGVKLDKPVGEISGGAFLFQASISLRTHVDGLLCLACSSVSEPIVEPIEQLLRQPPGHFPRNRQRSVSYAGLIANSPQYVRHVEQLPKADHDPSADEGLVWKQMGHSHGVLDIRDQHIRAHYGYEPFIERFEPTFRLIDLHRCFILFECSAAVSAHIQEIRVTANQYELLRCVTSDLRPEPCDFDRFQLPDDLGHIDPTDDWHLIRPSDFPSYFSPDFNRTPRRWLPVDA